MILSEILKEIKEMKLLMQQTNKYLESLSFMPDVKELAKKRMKELGK